MDHQGKPALRHLLRHVSEGSQELLRALTSRDAERRERIATAVFNGFASGLKPFGTEEEARAYASAAVAWADALIDALDERAVKDAGSARDFVIDAGGK